ncbi:hypothetical protein EC973_007124 [Apophysomyces ossiformis]|uniref:Uncharacterized protein n=1 Tax=Apophysomyces ossiformis TaxID=679940 RepID=A0A8H7EUG4_9FUNG|nr:hypothetical protein EC973_007124 [Apophysomyces ossiformis]
MASFENEVKIGAEEDDGRCWLLEEEEEEEEGNVEEGGMDGRLRTRRTEESMDAEPFRRSSA